MSDTNLLMEKAQRFADEQRWQEAVEVARKALALTPNNTWIKDKLGWYLSRAKQYLQAIAVYEELMLQTPDKAKYPYMIGYQYYDQQQYVKAIPWFEKALSLNTNYIVVLYRQGYAEVHENNISKGEKLFVRCVRAWRQIEDEEERKRASKDYASACFQLGKIYADRFDYENAAKAFASAVEYDSENHDKLYNLGKALVKLERFEEALQALQTADRLKPRQHYIQAYLARAQQGVGQIAAAERLYKRIPEHVKNKFPYIWTFQAEMYVQQKCFAEAIQTLLPITKRPNPKIPQNWFHTFILLGQAYEGTDDIVEAYRAYKHADEWKHGTKAAALVQERLKILEQLARERNVNLI